MTLKEWLQRYPGVEIVWDYLRDGSGAHGVTVLGPGGGNMGPAWRDMHRLSDYVVSGDNGGICAVLRPQPEPLPADCLPPPNVIERLLRGPELDDQGRITSGLWEGMTPEQVLQQLERYRRVCGE